MIASPFHSHPSLEHAITYGCSEHQISHQDLRYIYFFMTITVATRLGPGRHYLVPRSLQYGYNLSLTGFFFSTCFTMHTCSYGLAKMIDYHSISLIKTQTPFHSSTNPLDLIHTCFSLLYVSFLPSSSNNTVNESLWGSRICDMAGYAIRNKIRYCLYHPRANILLEQPDK